MALDALQQLIDRFERQPQWQTQRQFRQVLTHWGSTVGASVAAQTQPVRIDQGVLQVAVTNAAWGQTLLFERQRILTKLNDSVTPSLKDIRFSTGDWFRRPRAQRQAASEDSAELRSHPSYLPLPLDQAGGAAADSAQPALPRPGSARAAFEQWAVRHQQLTQHQPQCPSCHSPCPPGELQRWSVCSLCAAKTWRSR
jgi:predicted nucleic acid-binding Zn ribbon protein